MPSYFPPNYLFPDEIDNDHTLFAVFNTTDTIITADNPAWSDEIEIKPQSADKEELWADNGFATISGELLYYDQVEKNNNDRVIKLKRCCRNIGGKPTKYNSKNTPIRSFVIAEHHERLALTAIEIEKFIGKVDCADENTLVCCLNDLDIANCQDDNVCPDVQFDYQILSADPCEGTQIQYEININGSFNFFQIDFGDGTSSLIPNNGTKQYSPGAVIDPFVTVKNDTCEIVITGIQRVNDNEPNPSQQPIPLTIDVPNFTFPEINLPSIDIPDVDIQLPTIVEQCIDLSPISTLSGISIGDINIPSTISIIAPNISPISLIVPPITPISLIGTLPDEITVVGTLPSTITLVGSLPSTISITGGNIPSRISITGTVPSSINVNWGSPPQLSCVVSVACPGAPGMAARMATSSLVNPYSALDDEYDAFSEFNTFSELNASNNTISSQFMRADNASSDQMKVDYEIGGIPSVIMVQAPEFPTIKIEHDIPNTIQLIAPNIPTAIQVMGMFELPSEIRYIGPEKIVLDASTLPEKIILDAPTSIKLDCIDMPKDISIVHDIPSVISVVGMTDTIKVVGIPDVLLARFVIDEPVPIVFKAEPLEMIVKVDMQKLVTDDGEGHTCVAIVPCKK